MTTFTFPEEIRNAFKNVELIINHTNETPLKKEARIKLKQLISMEENVFLKEVLKKALNDIDK